MTKQQREKQLEVSRYFGRTIRPSSEDLMKKALKKDGLSVQNIGKPQVAFVFAVFLLMSIFLSWIEQEDLALVILYKKFPSLEPLFREYPRDREGRCPLNGGVPEIEVALGSVCTQGEKKMTVAIVDRS